MATVQQSLSVLVIGAGELGQAMVVALASHFASYQISVLLRPSTIETTDPSKSEVNKYLQSLGATFVSGDYQTDSESTLSSIFAKYHTVIVCSGFAHGAAGLQTKITRAALAANVPLYIPWQFGIDYDILGAGSSQDSFDEQLEVRKLLRNQESTSWIIVSTGVFMSFLFEPWWGVVDLENNIIRALGSWKTKITTTTPEDIGTITIDILAEAEQEDMNKVIFIAGETLSYEDLAQNVEKGTGRKMNRELWDNKYLMEELKKDPENGLKKYRPIFAGPKWIAWDYASSWNAKRGIRTTSTEEYARNLVGMA